MWRFYLELAFKNLFRAKRRMILTATAIAVGIFFTIAYDSFMSGMDRDAVKSMLELETGHFQIMAPASSKGAARDEKDEISLNHLLPDSHLISQKTAALPGITGVAPRLLFSVLVTNGLDELPVTGIGIDSELDGSVFRVREYVKGGWIHPGESKVVLGKRIAELLDIKLGDQITIRTQTRLKTFQALDLTVAGLINSPDPIVNNGQIFLPLDTAQKALDTGNAVTLLAVKTDSIERLSERIRAVKQLQSSTFPFRIKTWEESAKAFIADMELHRAFAVVLLAMVALIAVIGIVNSVLLASLERVREIGILKAMGMTEKEIIHLFGFEALGLGIIGGLAGVVTGILTNFYFVYVGIDFESLYGNLNIGFSLNKICGRWNWGMICGAFICGVIVSWLASFFPARKAARIDPVISLRRN